jgi:recombination endonuclease VII
MTRQEALKKAARLTKADVPTRVVKNAAQPGGYQTKAVAVVQAAHAKYRKTDKRRVALARYDKSLKGRAAHAKYRRTAKRHAVLARHRKVLNRQGLPITAADIEALRREWGGRCFVCWKKLRGRGHLDHCHDTGYARHLTCRSDNLIEGMLKKNGVRTYE